MTVEKKVNPALEKYTKHKITKNLLIIGNGFDLSSGLKSSYTNFFDSDLIQRKIPDINEYFNRVKNILDFSEHTAEKVVIFKKQYNGFALQNIDFFDNPDINIWNLIFRKPTKEDLNWNNIEHKIEEIVCNKYPLRITATNIETVCYKLKNDLTIILSGEANLVNFGLGAYVNHNKKWNQDIYEFLLEELKKFELQFWEYLRGEVQGNERYKSKVEEVLKKINISESNVINFNYTTIAESTKVRSESNVHGSLERENVIFGIDLANLNSSDEALNFSKTYRKMHSFEEHSISKYNHESLLSRSIERISFFGHSLNTSDYSYFQSIFDFYEIYNSNVSLVFYYQIYDTKISLEIKKDFTNAVINLLNTYGGTMVNKHHGKNLLHKLMLEERVFLKEIQVQNESVIDK